MAFGNQVVFMVNYNGDLLPETTHFLNHDNRGLQYGDALTERVRHTGATLAFWEDHYFRLMASMRQLRMEIPMEFTPELLEGEIQKTIGASGLSVAPSEVCITIFRNRGKGLLPGSRDVSYVISVTALEHALYPDDGPGLVADLFKDYYIQADGLARLPHNGKLPLVLASIYADENDLDTCLILNHRKEVALGLHGNLFLRKGDEIRTPPLSGGCPDGVLRKFLLGRNWGETRYRLSEADISPFELQQADELFMVDTSYGITSITNYRKAAFGREAATVATAMINEALKGNP